MKGYVKGVETLTSKLTNNYNDYRVRTPDFDDSLQLEIELEYERLEENEWNLDNLFNIHFPNLQRRSALITLFSIFECELNEYCNFLQETLSLNLGYQDINGRGIDRSIKYIEKVIEVDISSLQPIRDEIKTIQFIRNFIVHQGGELIFNSNERAVNDVLKFIEQKRPLLSTEDGFTIKAGYLMYVITLMEEYFSKLERIIQKEKF